jgi:hypothetical protein
LSITTMALTGAVDTRAPATPAVNTRAQVRTALFSNAILKEITEI